jgi:hypothetical protein
MATTGSMVNVIGIAIEMPMVAVRPGIAPMISPMITPIHTANKHCQDKMYENPKAMFSQKDKI